MEGKKGEKYKREQEKKRIKMQQTRKILTSSITQRAALVIRMPSHVNWNLCVSTFQLGVRGWNQGIPPGFGSSAASRASKISKPAALRAESTCVGVIMSGRPSPSCSVKVKGCSKYYVQEIFVKIGCANKKQGREEGAGSCWATADHEIGA